ncbi:class I SAM-dependent methyltransferase [Salinarimonas rosea]|uniref:class I SAM-dependent methyltransferase n=1 Tax=Salinarimonas rosea TaxID=552063 RepID=UPI0003F59951|nr:class I SAM-dependent methyltransferase [Salinarimonas rosea]
MNASFDAYRESYEDEVARSIAFSGLSHDFFLAAKADFLAGLFARHFGERAPDLLDVGCGVGRLHPLLQPLVSRLVGTDVSAQSLARARQDNPFAEYREGDGGALPAEDASVDVALATCVVHHVPPACWPSFVADMRRVVRPGGLVVLIEHNPLNPGTRLAVARCPFDHDAVLLGARRARALLAQAGCTAVESAHILLAPTAAPWARGLERRLAQLPLGAQYVAWGRA